MLLSVVKKCILVLVILVLGIAFFGGDGIGNDNMLIFKNIDDVSMSKWETLAQKKIFFGHQSVGINLIEGMREIIRESPQIKLRILEDINEERGKDIGFFAHSRVGENRKPGTKLREFVDIIENKLDWKPDVVALKFCYVDALKNTDVREIFSAYKATMEKIKNKYPDVQIIHFTMPLMTQDISWKARLKSLIGKDSWEFADNMKRNEYNQLLKHEYFGKELIFDIADYEATSSDGIRTTFRSNGKEYLAMLEDYSSDGGHLSEKGRKAIAEQFLVYLAEQL